MGDKRLTIAAAATAAVVGLGVVSLSQPGTAETPRYEAGDVVGYVEGVGDAETLEQRILSGEAEPVSTATPYGEAVLSELGLAKAQILRHAYKDAAGSRVVIDQVNRDSLATGYQASIYQIVPPSFGREHDEIGFPTIETGVGKAWYSVQDGSISLLTLNQETRVAVRIVYFDAENELPTVQAIADRAVRLSSNQAIVEQVASFQKGD